VPIRRYNHSILSPASPTARPRSAAPLASRPHGRGPLPDPAALAPPQEFPPDGQPPPTGDRGDRQRRVRPQPARLPHHPPQGPLRRQRVQRGGPEGPPAQAGLQGPPE